MKVMNNKNNDKDFLSLLSSDPDDIISPLNPDMEADNDEKDDLRELFEGYSPELSSDSLFMAALDKRLGNVELVKSRIETMHKQNRRAVIFAGIAGVLCGIILTLLYPMLFDLVTRLSAMIIPAIPDISVYNHTFLLITLTALTVYATFSTYRLALK